MVCWIIKVDQSRLTTPLRGDSPPTSCVINAARDKTLGHVARGEHGEPGQPAGRGGIRRKAVGVVFIRLRLGFHLLLIGHILLDWYRSTLYEDISTDLPDDRVG